MSETKDDVSLIEEDGEVIGFRVNGKEFYAEEGRVEVEADDLKGFNLSSIPDGFFLELLGENTISFEGPSSDGKIAGVIHINTHIYRKYWYHKYGASQYVEAMKSAIEIRGKSEKDAEFLSIEDDEAHIFIDYRVYIINDMPIDQAHQKLQETITEIEGHTERLLEKEAISSEILKDEVRFTIELLLPLFRNMGFIDVKYNHGKCEYGKDVTFSEIDKFAVRRNYGVQVKAGDLSGEAGAEIDKIIGQLDDAFSMSYIDTTSREERYISDLIIAISGRFTDNAKDKIVEKIKRANIYFLDIDKIQDLLNTYMKKVIE
jgi:hypothetical protein